MITIQQIKAARALLNWKQSELAKASGLSIPAIAKIELGQGNPRQKTIEAIQKAFEDEGIEFLGSHGIDKKQERFATQTHYGREGLYFFWRDIEHVFQDGKGGDVMLSNLDERPFIKYFDKDMPDMFKRRNALNIRTRALVNESETFFLMPLEAHRAVPKVLFGQMLYVVYGDRVVIFDWQETLRLIWMQSRPLADTFRRQFEFHWAMGKPIDPKKATRWEL